MKKLKVIPMGSEVQGVRLYGDPKRQPEPIYFRVMFPFGDVDVVRTSDGAYWVHVRVNRPSGGGLPGVLGGRIASARINSLTPGAEFDLAALEDGGLCHLAVLVEPEPKP